MVKHTSKATSPFLCVPLSEKLRNKAFFPFFYMLLEKTIFQAQDGSTILSSEKISINYTSNMDQEHEIFKYPFYLLMA